MSHKRAIKSTPKLPDNWSTLTNEEKDEHTLKLIETIQLAIENMNLLYEEIKLLRNKNIGIIYKIFYVPFALVVRILELVITNYKIAVPVTIILWGMYLICSTL